MASTRPRALLVMRDWAYQTQFGPDELERLRALADLGPDETPLSELDSPAARARLADAEVLVTSWGCPRLDEDRLAAAPNLRAVFHSAGTVRSLVSDELWARGIRVTTAAEENAEPVAQFTFAAIVFAGKKAPFLAQRARTDRADWSYKFRHTDELGNLGRTVGLIGFSRIGARVAQRLLSLPVRTLVYDPFVDDARIEAAGGRRVELDELLTSSDIVSVHAPQLPSTHHMLGADQLALMRDRATLINTSRGSLIDTEALTAECASGRLDAILDVTDPEPLPPDSVLYDLPNVMITPHIAGSLGLETRLMSQRALTELARYIDGLPAEEEVTAEAMGVMA
ncbi:hydroxyacid dehydrogenase [Occultella glacieicola]|uniref:Hydroxyacid dehydrogenase n=1 Tax=Occultella glacieicola TaxID=2518684 RepID=A0ABY2E922_9MICO|nr:hydroxyacid dehydrogenase [Occultella glacieicola]TDE97616.1 hydroxyacid dehydrogenase [Occultella glacieicola]